MLASEAANKFNTRIEYPRFSIQESAGNVPMGKMQSSTVVERPFSKSEL